jgi:hypothetical protein
MLVSLPCFTQVVDRSGICTFLLPDQTEVTVIRGLSDDAATYYYLPSHLRISENEDHVPEFSFMTYKDDNGAEIKGSILHLLMYWGLTKQQEKHLQKQLSARDSTAIIAGPVSLEVPANGPSFTFFGDNAFTQLLKNKLPVVPVAPVIPGTKLALSYRFNASETKIVEDALSNYKKMEKDGIELHYVIRASDSGYALNNNSGDAYVLRTSFKDLLTSVNPTSDKSK